MACSFMFTRHRKVYKSKASLSEGGKELEVRGYIDSGAHRK